MISTMASTTMRITSIARLIVPAATYSKRYSTESTMMWVCRFSIINYYWKSHWYICIHSSNYNPSSRTFDHNFLLNALLLRWQFVERNKHNCISNVLYISTHSNVFHTLRAYQHTHLTLTLNHTTYNLILTFFINSKLYNRYPLL